jgi:predicted NBD/HSP70 family sugar kinase
MTRAALADVGLSRSTVQSVIEELAEAGVVIEIGPDTASGIGRRPILVGLRGSLGVTVGVEIANWTIRVAVCDLAQEPLLHTSAPSDAAADPVTTLTRASALIDEALARTGFRRDQVLGVGIALPGPIQRRTGLTGRACTLKPFVGVNCKELAREVLRLPVLVDNDANLAAIAEVTWGAAKGCRDLAYVYSATGLGVGFIVNGELYAGANGTAGEIGHTTIDENGLVCECGGRGCLNTLADPGAIIRNLEQSHGTGLTIDHVIALAHGGDAGCRRVLADAGRHIGVATANMYNLFDPELIVIGGSLAPAGEILIDPLRESMARRAIHAGEAIPPVIAGDLGEQAVVTGAAAAVLADAASFPLPLGPGDLRARGRRPARVSAPPEYPPSTQPTALPQKVE